jgi:hypothetical protein
MTSQVFPVVNLEHMPRKKPHLKRLFAHKAEKMRAIYKLA